MNKAFKSSLPNEELLNSVANSIPALISYVDTDFRYQFVNNSYEEWFGEDKSKILGKKVVDLVGEEVFKDVEAYFKKAFQGELVEFELYAPYKNAKPRYIAVSYTPVFNKEDSSVQGVTTMVRDITTLKKTQDELIEAKLQAEKISEYKSRFLANISHEIRTPMTAIIGFTEILKNSNLKKSINIEAVDRIDRSSELLLKLIDDILFFSKFEAGKLPLDIRRFKPKELVEEVMSMLEFQAKRKDIYIKYHIDLKPNDFFISDPLRIQQILINLIGNSIKFTTKGGVTVHSKILEVYGEQNLYFEIVDTGKGIKKEAQGSLFEAFKQEDSSINRKYGGSGLGLALSKRLAHHLGGDIKIKYTNPGEGSSFEFWIPLQTLESIDKEDKISSPDRELTLEGLSILVVDDTIENLRLFKIQLEQVGAKVYTASSGKEALEKVDEINTFDIVLMDLQMPEMSGAETTDKLRSQGYIAPIVALTAHGMKEDVEESLRSGFNAHLVKPLPISELVSSIVELIKK